MVGLEPTLTSWCSCQLKDICNHFLLNANTQIDGLFSTGSKPIRDDLQATFASCKSRAWPNTSFTSPSRRTFYKSSALLKHVKLKQYHQLLFLEAQSSVFTYFLRFNHSSLMISFTNSLSSNQFSKIKLTYQST